MHLRNFAYVLLIFRMVLADAMDNEMVGTVQYPGTLWCGPGNSAKGPRDLGLLIREDLCCREHDHCPYSINPLQTKWTRFNGSPFVASHCQCDNELIRCLRNVNSDESYQILFLFNRFSALCFHFLFECSNQFLRISNRCARFDDGEYKTLQFVSSNLTMGSSTYPNGTAISINFNIPTEGTPTPPPEAPSFRGKEVYQQIPDAIIYSPPDNNIPQPNNASPPKYIPRITYPPPQHRSWIPNNGPWIPCCPIYTEYIEHN